MGAGIFHLSYDPGPRCFSLSVRVLWSLSFAKDRITHPAAVGRSVQLLQPCHPTVLGVGSQGKGKNRAVRLGPVLALADNLPRTGYYRRESRNIVLEEVPRSGVLARAVRSEKSQPTNVQPHHLISEHFLVIVPEIRPCIYLTARSSLRSGTLRGRVCMYLQGRADGAGYQAPQAARLFETSLKTRLA